MDNDLIEHIARTLEVDPQLLPLIPELLTDVWQLGSDPTLIVSILHRIGVTSKSKILDLGCGKGGVAVTMAKKLECYIEGIDAFPVFIDTARMLASKRGVNSRCHFRQADLREFLGNVAQYDVVLFLRLGPVEGNHQKTIEGLRSLVKPGGYIVIDDAFLKEGININHLPAYKNCLCYSDTVHQLTVFGDKLVEEIVTSPDKIYSINHKNTDIIRRNADFVKARFPALVNLIDDYIYRQEIETQIFGTELMHAVWALQRT